MWARVGQRFPSRKTELLVSFPHTGASGATVHHDSVGWAKGPAPAHDPHQAGHIPGSALAPLAPRTRPDYSGPCPAPSIPGAGG